jgi:hypothetical protein
VIIGVDVSWIGKKINGKICEIPLLLGFENSGATANILPLVTPHQKKIKFYSIPKFSPLVQGTK